MQEQELIKKIHDCIKSYYNAEYIGYMNVEKLEEGYKFSIGIPNDTSPTTISTNIDDAEQFLEYVCLELRKRNYMRVEFYKAIKQHEDRIQ